MYFSGQISINPTQATEIDIIKPTKAFSRILNFITAGGLEKKQERETFTAISILQQFNTVFRGLKITNIIRLCYNDIPFYEDKEGVEDDLAIALDTFELETDALTSELFKTLTLVLEHHDSDFQYLLEVNIKREHSVDEDPITLKVNALLNELNVSESEQQSVKRKLGENVFASQESHDAYLATKQKAFNAFFQTLELEIRKFIHSEALTTNTSKSLIRPASKRSASHTPRGHSSEPVFCGYRGSNVGDFIFYSMIWSEMSHSHGMHVHDTAIFSEDGTHLIDVGAEGIDANQEAILDPATDLESIPESEGGTLSETTESSFFSLDSGDSGDSGASCSSCSSCGGD